MAVALAGLENLSQPWADEAASGKLRFYTLDPGRIKTALRHKFYPTEFDSGLRAPDDK